MGMTRDFMGECPVQVTVGKIILDGSLCIPEQARGVVLFAHGSGSSRHSPRNQYVARELRKAGLASLLFDLLTGEEDEIDARSGELRFNIGLLARRLIGATDWIAESSAARKLKIGYFGASTGAAAALVAASARPELIKAVVSRGGRPDLAGEALTKVKAPTLLIVGGRDEVVIDLNREALSQLNTEKQLVTVAGATHLFEEPGTLEEVARVAAEWFNEHLA
jgi:putative phosphoribosyl transferase